MPDDDPSSYPLALHQSHQLLATRLSSKIDLMNRILEKKDDDAGALMERESGEVLDAAKSMEGSWAGETREFGGIEFAWCPPGEFLMGSPASEADHEDNEKQHRVTLTRGFWMAKTETTQGQWKAVMGTSPAEQEAKGNSFGKVNGLGSTHPMYFVSWEDAQEYCEKLNREQPLGAGWKWTLPTEAQWEYACRAGTTGPYAGELEAMAWYRDNSDSQTHPVGTKKANAWGLSDMHGNVWEWCQDWYGDYYADGQRDPAGPVNGSSRVSRGGCWFHFAGDCRSAYRSGLLPGSRFIFLGFRVVVSSSQ